MKRLSLKKIFIPLIIIIALILSFIFINIYINNNNLKKYIKDNNYIVDKYDLYTLEKNNNDETIIYQLLLENYFISKTIIIDDNNNILKLCLNYKKNKTIEMEMEYNGLNNNNNFAIQAQKAKLINNNLIDCETILDNNFDSKCDIMEEEAKEFNNEVKNILNNYNINLNYIKKSQN